MICWQHLSTKNNRRESLSSYELREEAYLATRFSNISSIRELFERHTPPILKRGDQGLDLMLFHFTLGHPLTQFQINRLGMRQYVRQIVGHHTVIVSQCSLLLRIQPDLVNPILELAIRLDQKRINAIF